MGVQQRVRRPSTPVVLALALALAGSISPASRENGTPSVLAISAAAPAAPAAPASQSAASVTPVEPVEALALTGQTLKPAVRIASTGPVARDAVRVDIADVLLRAYRSAADAAPASCHLPVSLLAAIGQVESGSLVGRPLDAEHRTSVLGPALNGDGFAAIPDTDQGRWDGDKVWDRAVGPMQFIPGTWRAFGADGDGDGAANPQDVEDAAAATAAYLCYGGRDLSRPADLRAAILSYNQSEAYLALVSTYQQRYAALGLDQDLTLTGLPSTISMVATPLQSFGTGPVAAAPEPRDLRPAGKRSKPADAEPKPTAGTDAAPAPAKPSKTPAKPTTGTDPVKPPSAGPETPAPAKDTPPPAEETPPAKETPPPAEETPPPPVEETPPPPAEETPPPPPAEEAPPPPPEATTPPDTDVPPCEPSSDGTEPDPADPTC